MSFFIRVSVCFILSNSGDGFFCTFSSLEGKLFYFVCVLFRNSRWCDWQSVCMMGSAAVESQGTHPGRTAGQVSIARAIR